MKTTPKTKQPLTLEECINGNKTEIRQTLKQITESWFTEAQGKFKDNGGNDYSDFSELGLVALRFIDSFENKPFSANDFILSATYLDLPFETVTSFFYGFITFLYIAKRLQITRAQDSAYEYDTYYFLK